MRAPILTALLLAACAGPQASLSEADCRNANWYELGRTDALLGRQPQSEAYRRGCPALQDNDYLAGWGIGYSEWDSRVSRR